MGCLKLNIIEEPILSVAYSKKGQKVSKNRGGYYPFGMTLKGINDVTTANGNSLAQRYMYNQGTSGKDFQGKEGKSFKVERQFDLSLNVDMTKFRMYDYALGRFTSIDPLADANPQESLTPYQYAYNNPVLYNDPYGDCPKCWDFVVNVFKSTTVKSVSISLGVGAKVSNTGAVASVSEFKYDLKSNKFSYSAGEGFIGVGDSQDAIKGQVKIGYSSKNFDNDKTEGGFIKLEGSAINEGNEKGGSVSIFAKNEKGEKGAVLIENEDAEVDASEVSSPSNDTSGKFKFGFGISFSFDWVKFEELQNESKQKRDFPERE